MKWIHWSEKEPEHEQWIFVCFPPYEDDPPLMGIQRHCTYPGILGRNLDDPETRNIHGWQYWMPLSEVPIPDEYRRDE